uniref:G-protein coupled receptors family 1 profile domain-containing protein n=1 Tax=Meloidogyne enterolobii TaxID=390850 RepID=A0A6V7V6R2_MELEN|nr:unnamed protein product [Meloidogyne enterolobii]
MEEEEKFKDYGGNISINNISSDIKIENNYENDINYRIKMYQVVIPAFLFLSLLAVIANSLVILALKASRVRNATVTLLLSLTFSDIWSSSVMALSLLINSYLPTVLHTQPRPCVSLALEMLRTGGLLTAALHLLLIALNHCVGIVRPHMDKHRLRRIAFLLCICAWSFPSIILFILSLSRENQGLFNCERVDFYNEKVFRWAVAGLLAILFLAITLCYARLLCLMHSRNNIVNNNKNENSLPQSARSNNSNERKRRRERRTLWTTLLICASFLLGWAPASVLFAITCSECRLLSSIGSFRLLFGLSCIQLSFLLAKSLLNPLIYSLRIPEVREQFNRQINRIQSLEPRKYLIRSWHKATCSKSKTTLATTTTSPPTSPWKWRRTQRARSHLFGSSISSATNINLINGNGGGRVSFCYDDIKEEGGEGQQQKRTNNFRLNSLRELFRQTFKQKNNLNNCRRTRSEINKRILEQKRRTSTMTIKGFKENKRRGARMSECPDWLQFNGRISEFKPQRFSYDGGQISRLAAKYKKDNK